MTQRALATVLLLSFTTSCVSWHPIPPAALTQIAAEPADQRVLVEDQTLIPLPPETKLTLHTLHGETYEGTVSSLSLLDGQLAVQPPGASAVPLQATSASVTLPAPGRTAILTVGIAATVAALAAAAVLTVAIARGIGGGGIGG
jgi:hypothetical protein